MARFRVLREHFGDRAYAKGDMRDAPAAEVEHLVKAGVLKKAVPLAKAKPVASNKAKPAAANKSARSD